MNRSKVAPLFAVLFLFLGLAGAGAQAFFPMRVAGTAEVKFTANVDGVQVSIDDQPVGLVPVTVYVLPGVHRFTFTAPGSAPKTIPYPVSGDTEVPYIATQKLYPLTVTVNPPNASVAIDGKPLAGNTTSITSGNHTLTVSAPGYQPLTLPFNQPAQANVLNLTLVASTFPLTITVNPPNASIAIDGIPLAGRSTSVSAGNHTLTLSAPGYQPMTLPFVQPAQANVLNITLVASTFPLTVTTNVPNALVSVDGVPINGNTTSVTAGNHTLSVSAPGYLPLTLPFVQPSQANVLNLTLMALPGTLVVNTDRLFKTGTSYKLFIGGAEVRGLTQSLTAGLHSVRLVAGPLVLETSVTVTTGQTVNLTPSIQWEVR